MAEQPVPAVVSGETFEGATLEEALAKAKARLGAQATVTEVKVTRKGGLAGFFAKEVTQVTVQAGKALEAAVVLPALTAIPADRVDPVEDAVALFASGDADAQAVTYQRPTGAAPSAAPSPFAVALAALADDPQVEAAVARADGAAGVVVPGSSVEAVPVGEERRSGLAGALREMDAVTPAQSPDQSPAPSPVDGPAWDRTGVEERSEVAAPARDVNLPSGVWRALAGIDPDLFDDRLEALAREEGDMAAVADFFRRTYGNPSIPVLDAGQVVVVYGTGPDVLTAARVVAEAVGANPAHVYVTGPETTSAGVRPARRINTVAAARQVIAKQQKAPVVLAVDTGWTGPDRTVAKIVEAFAPAFVWAAVDATRRVEVLDRWLALHEGVELLLLVNGEFSCAPAETLALGIPVGFIDGRPATPKQWASVLSAAVAG